MLCLRKHERTVYEKKVHFKTQLKPIRGLK